jgi:hypothetical protein
VELLGVAFYTRFLLIAVYAPTLAALADRTTVSRLLVATASVMQLVVGRVIGGLSAIIYGMTTWLRASTQCLPRLPPI